MKSGNWVVLPFVLLVIMLSSALNINGQMKVGETLNYKITFGGILKGDARIQFYGKIASFAKYETLYVSTDCLMSDSTLKAVLVDSTNSETVIDSTEEKISGDSAIELQADSLVEVIPDSIKAVRTLVTNIYFITYNTHFIGNIYNLNASIYATDNFLPLLIETKIDRTGKTSYGRELFFPDRKMAIFSQNVENKQEIDTIFRKYPLQDITTLPFYLMNIDFDGVDTIEVSLAQGELKLHKVGKREVIIGEENFNTELVKSRPEELKVWLNRKDRLPIKVEINKQKIKMYFKSKEVNGAIDNKLLGINKEKIKVKLSHIINNM